MMRSIDMRIAVTGGSGKLGRAVVAELLAHGYAVANLDRVPSKEPRAPFTQVDFTDFGQTLQAMTAIDDRYERLDGVVHLAAIPGPGMAPNATIFANNVISSYNVFEAARRAGIKNVVWASSETVLGLPFDVPPSYIPVDEDVPLCPASAYSLGKAIDEEMALHFCRWDPELKMIGLRFSNVMEVSDYEAFASFDADPMLRKWNLWSYIDARDGAQAVRRALEHRATGLDIFIIASPDTVMSRPNAELIATVFPDVPLKRPVEANETLLSIDKARRVLGYEPRYSWRDTS
jgi:nucleoside-diphosphate-sugar epimerase